MLKALLITVVVLAAVVASPWLLARLARRYGVEASPVPSAPPTPRPGFDTFDPSLRERAAVRRRHAETIREHAARVDSGDRAVEKIRLVR